MMPSELRLSLLSLAGLGALVLAASLVAAAGVPSHAGPRLAMVLVAWAGLAALLAWMFVPRFGASPRATPPLGALDEAQPRRARRGRIALTFDDGPHPETTPALLDALARAGVRATFFLVGEHVRRWPELARRIAEAGHTVGNHTERHRLLVFRTGREVDAEIGACQTSIGRVLGVRPSLFRPPHGFKPVCLGATLRRHGLRLVTWDGHIRDTDAPGSDAIVRRALRVARRGRVLLLHDNPSTGGQTAAALATLVTVLRNRGFALVPLDDTLPLPG